MIDRELVQAVTKEDFNALKVIGRRYIENWHRLSCLRLEDGDWQMKQRRLQDTSCGGYGYRRGGTAN